MGTITKKVLKDIVFQVVATRVFRLYFLHGSKKIHNLITSQNLILSKR